MKVKANWKINIRNICEKKGIPHAFALWQKVWEKSGGSKQTAYDLWSGEQTMIQLETLNKLFDELGIMPHEIFVNESDDFNNPSNEVKEIEPTKTEKSSVENINDNDENLSTADRFTLCELFIKTTENKILNKTDTVEFSESEKKAFKEIVRIIEPMMNGWKNSGRPRDENPSKAAKYLRDYRAKKKSQSS